MQDTSKYSDIINMPHHVSRKHPHMSLYARSAQFAPFAALTGYEEAVEETERLTDRKIEIDEEIRLNLDRKYNELKENINKRPHVTFTYFIPDKRKEGGAYETITGVVKKIDEYNYKIILEDENSISINEIIDIQIKY